MKLVRWPAVACMSPLPLSSHATCRTLNCWRQPSDDELWKLYNKLDVLLLPSVNSYEAFGLVQIEAMLAGALVVASYMRGVRIPIGVTGNLAVWSPLAVSSPLSTGSSLAIHCAGSNHAIRSARGPCNIIPIGLCANAISRS